MGRSQRGQRARCVAHAGRAHANLLCARQWHRHSGRVSAEAFSRLSASARWRIGGSGDRARARAPHRRTAWRPLVGRVERRRGFDLLHRAARRANAAGMSRLVRACRGLCRFERQASGDTRSRRRTGKKLQKIDVSTDVSIENASEHVGERDGTRGSDGGGSVGGIVDGSDTIGIDGNIGNIGNIVGGQSGRRAGFGCGRGIRVIRRAGRTNRAAAVVRATARDLAGRAREHRAGRGRRRPRHARRAQPASLGRVERLSAVSRRPGSDRLFLRHARGRSGGLSVARGAGEFRRAARSADAARRRLRGAAAAEGRSVHGVGARDRAHDHRRSARDRALLRAGLQRLHHEARRVRRLYRGGAPARVFPAGREAAAGASVCARLMGVGR
ncbi:putative Thioredoxin reductase [Paraburkholderia tropica]